MAHLRALTGLREAVAELHGCHGPRARTSGRAVEADELDLAGADMGDAGLAIVGKLPGSRS